jgi:diaminopimelate epimerase
MKLHFTKMHGIGNDFIVFDATRQALNLSAMQLRQLADRHFGIGCDQILYVEAPSQAGVDFAYRIFNADGGEVEQCGNGARCFARFVRDKGLSTKDELVVSTRSGIIHLYLHNDGQVTVNMGQPRFEPSAIPLLCDTAAPRYCVDIAGTTLHFGSVSMGNPHAVLRVDDVDTAPVASVGAALEQHPLFPKRVNVGFMHIVDRQHIRLRVFERGSGETLACGTGACAAVVIGQRWGALDERVTVALPGGNVDITWDNNQGPVWMTGPAVSVYEGIIQL